MRLKESCNLNTLITFCGYINTDFWLKGFRITLGGDNWAMLWTEEDYFKYWLTHTHTHNDCIRLHNWV